MTPLMTDYNDDDDDHGRYRIQRVWNVRSAGWTDGPWSLLAASGLEYKFVDVLLPFPNDLIFHLVDSFRDLAWAGSFQVEHKLFVRSFGDGAKSWE